MASLLSPLLASLVHAVRNAVDHGLETPEERLERGKPEAGHITIETVATGDQLQVSVRDDGRGIAWDRVRARAERLGLTVVTQHELADTLFTDGFSTAETVSALSGRGVGLSAIRDACRLLGGDCEIGANPSGVGTQITCTVSLLAVTESGLRDVASRAHAAGGATTAQAS